MTAFECIQNPVFDSVRIEAKEEAIRKLMENLDLKNDFDGQIELEIDSHDAFDYENHEVPKFNVS